MTKPARKAHSTQRNFWLINYSSGHDNWCLHPCALAAVSVLPPSWTEWSKLRCLAFLFKMSVDYSLSEQLICISSYTLFTRMVCSSKSESAQTKNEYYEHCTPKGVASHPIHPPGSAPVHSIVCIVICKKNFKWIFQNLCGALLFLIDTVVISMQWMHKFGMQTWLLMLLGEPLDLQVQGGFKSPKMKAWFTVNCLSTFTWTFISLQLLTVVHSPIQTMVAWILPREQLWTKWPIIAVTMDMYWLETWHVPAR